MPVTSMCCVHKLSSDIMLVFIHTLMGVRDIMILCGYRYFTFSIRTVGPDLACSPSQ